MGERRSPEPGETTLAAATAAIITARWQQSAGANGHAAGPYANGHASSNGHPSGVARVDPPRHAATGNGQPSNGQPAGGFSDWAPPPAAPTSGEGFGGGGGPDPTPAPISPAPTAPFAPPPPVPPPVVHGQGPGIAAAAAAFMAPEPGASGFTPAEPAGSGFVPREPAGSAFSPPEPVGTGFVPPEPAGSGFVPAEPAGSGFAPREPAGPGFVPAEPAGSAFFSAANAEPVPEVFGAHTHAGDAGGGWDRREAGGPHEEVRTQVPPGFERRNFGPFPEEPAPPGGGWGATHARGDARTEAPGLHEAVPSALLGVLPPPPVAPPSLAPSTLAPPEPAPWVDTGWVDFARDLEPGAALVGAGAGVATAAGVRVPLPRRVPRVPDMDFPLFDSDPTEPPPDPVAERQELNRIADFLRDDDEARSPEHRPDGVDLEAVLGAVRQVPEVRDAQLRWNAQAGHTLRIEFADGVDEGEVTRSVVRLLRSQLGLGSRGSAGEPTVDSPHRGRVSAATARVPARSTTPLTGGRPLPRPSGVDAPRLVVDNVTVTRLGTEATVEVRLRTPGGRTAVGEGRGPGVDAYLSRLAATAAAHAVDQALATNGPARGKVFVEHVSVVPFGVQEVAVVVLLLSSDGVAEQVSGSAIVRDDPHQAVVRATLAALNRRLESLLG